MEEVMQLHKRLGKLEAKAPTELRTVHLVGVMPGETEEEARSRYGRPTSEDDMLILLVGKEPIQ
jgi:hypothetical protein